MSESICLLTDRMLRRSSTIVPFTHHYLVFQHQADYVKTLAELAAETLAESVEPWYADDVLKIAKELPLHAGILFAEKVLWHIEGEESYLDDLDYKYDKYDIHDYHVRCPDCDKCGLCQQIEWTKLKWNYINDWLFWARVIAKTAPERPSFHAIS